MSWILTIDEILQATGGQLLNAPQISGPNSEAHGVGTDTRQDLSGLLFVALKGDVFDAHGFLDKAAAQGAACLLVHSFDPKFKHLLDTVNVVEVKDTLVALQKLGNFWRRKMKAKILGVTGTNGKTTTKEFTAAILSTKFKTQYSKGSFNNHWGVPISLLSIQPEHEVAVIEMGMNHAGEIKTLVEIAEPDVVLVTMVGRGHLEGLGSIEAVAEAKSEIYEYASNKTQFIFNVENPHTRKMFENYLSRSHGKALLFGTPAQEGFAKSAQRADLDVALRVDFSDAESISVSGHIMGLPGAVKVPVFGVHNVANLMAAASFGLACGLTPQEVWSALPECRSGWGRNQWVKVQSAARVLFDAYNANPESMRAATENFSRLAAETGGRKIGVFGEMREMGAAAAHVHLELGEAVGKAGFDEVIFIGPSGAEFTAGMRAAGFPKNPLVSISCEHFLASGALPVLHANDIVLMKGSRGVGLERLLKDWKPIDFTFK